jgi:hypothetical protein
MPYKASAAFSPRPLVPSLLINRSGSVRPWTGRRDAAPETAALHAMLRPAIEGAGHFGSRCPMPENTPDKKPPPVRRVA